jgi:hypothetical protein
MQIEQLGRSATAAADSSSGTVTAFCNPGGLSVQFHEPKGAITMS